MAKPSILMSGFRFSVCCNATGCGFAVADQEGRDHVQRPRKLRNLASDQHAARGARDLVHVSVNDKVHEATKLGAVFDALLGQGFSTEEILRGVGVAPERVHSPNMRISLQQLITAYQNAIRLSTDGHLPCRIGRTIHVSTYGMYGYALLSCPDFRKAMEFAAKYHALAAPMATIEFREEGEVAMWQIEPIAHASSDRRLYRFIAELQIGVHISLMRDIMGPTFVPKEISLTYPRAGDFGLTAELVGCDVRFEQSANQILFESRWLDQAASLGNKTTYAAVLSLCDDLLEDLRLRIGAAGRIRAILLRDIANPPTFAMTAKLLDINARSLRRQLQQQGLSFRGLLDELRTQLALKYLRNTDLANEDIALALGFSDAANFRRAFHRWTNKSPSEVRAE
jgi:AraC-like DNA-binding protein